MRNILLSNDDGVYADGLRCLADTLGAIAKVTVVAPDRDRSGASNSLTLKDPLRLCKLSNNYTCVEGTPTDCVHLAITGYLDHEPDMVISGINSGANLGDDVLYSGTVAAAMEGRFLGLPAIAVSLSGSEFNNYQTAADLTMKIIIQLCKEPLPGDTILNINVPDLPMADIKGFEITRLGHRHRSEPVVKDVDPRGRPIYWVGPAGGGQDAGFGTDFYAVSQNKVSITPIKVDLTNHSAIEPLRGWVQGLSL